MQERSAKYRWASAHLGLAVLLAGCGDERGGARAVFVLTTPRETYQASLKDAGLDQTALGRDWQRSAEQSLWTPSNVATPYREVRFLDPRKAAAVSYRIALERGQRIAARVEAAEPTDDLRMFVDLFYESETSGNLELVRSADSLDWHLDYVARRPGHYVVRVQPELLRGGRFTVTVSSHASLDFPVAGHTLGSVRSGFGDSRDGGRREHHGLDIFARRGTPVLAAVAGRARPRRNGLGGTVVWLRDTENGRNLYYAHLDRWAFDRSRWVEPGDTIGFVGNSGNARTTPPHLHFGVYMRGTGPVDPYPQLYESPESPAEFRGDLRWVGQQARIGTTRTELRDQPRSRGITLADLAQHTSLEILAGSGRWYRVQLPDRRRGYVEASAVELLDRPTVLVTASRGSTILAGPSSIASAVDTVVVGEVLPVLRTYGDYAYVENRNGNQGWVNNGWVVPNATEAAANN